MDKHVFLDILETVAKPSCEELFPDDDYMFQQDNDPKHTAKIVKRWILKNLNTIDWWPAQSPDLNPIENLWSILDSRLRARTCNTEVELFQILQEGWRELGADLLTKLVESMPRRIEAVLQARGGPTKY
jgi:transposase